VPLLALAAALLLFEVAFRRVQIDWRGWWRRKPASDAPAATDALLARKRAVEETRRARVEAPRATAEAVPPQARPVPPSAAPPVAPPALPSATLPPAAKPPDGSPPESTVGKLLARKRERERGS
jgi:hypothetical protein